MSWKAIGIARGFDGDREQIDDMLEQAYRKGRKDERKKMNERYGERYGERDGGRGGYGMRKPWDDDDDEEDDDYGERRGVRGTGPYSRFRRY